MIVANTSRFTTPQHAGQDDGASMSTLPTFNILQSLTFAVMPDDEVDKGLLSWMNIQLPGFEGVFSMPRPFFLICKQQLGVLGSGLGAGFVHPFSALTGKAAVTACTNYSHNYFGQLYGITGGSQELLLLPSCRDQLDGCWQHGRVQPGLSGAVQAGKPLQQSSGQGDNGGG
jgi:hypothetical protein